MKSNNLPHELPPMEKSFQIEVSGGFTKKRFVGDFTCRIPNIKDQCLIEKHRAFLNGDMVNQLPPGVLKTHQMIAYLRYTLTEYPKFWKDSDLGYELRDLNVIEDIYNKVLEFEESWMAQVWGDDREEAPNEKEK